MASAAVLFSTTAALLLTCGMLAFGDPSPLQIALGYIVTGQCIFWVTILFTWPSPRGDGDDRKGGLFGF